MTVRRPRPFRRVHALVLALGVLTLAATPAVAKKKAAAKPAEPAPAKVEAAGKKPAAPAAAAAAPAVDAAAAPAAAPAKAAAPEDEKARDAKIEECIGQLPKDLPARIAELRRVHSVRLARINRLEKLAMELNDAALVAQVARLREKEPRRAGLALERLRKDVAAQLLACDPAAPPPDATPMPPPDGPPPLDPSDAGFLKQEHPGAASPAAPPMDGGSR